MFLATNTEKRYTLQYDIFKADEVGVKRPFSEVHRLGIGYYRTHDNVFYGCYNLPKHLPCWLTIIN